MTTLSEAERTIDELSSEDGYCLILEGKMKLLLLEERI